MKLPNVLLLLSLTGPAMLSAGEIPADAQRRIQAAAPDRPQVAPQRPRRVLVFNTPAHLMEKDPHKGYCIPYGEAALNVLGRKTGAYEPVVSDDLAHFLPETIRQYDAIVLNNTSGSWITPTPADMAKPAFQKHGGSLADVEKICRQSFVDYLEQGGGVVLLHFAIAANPHWPEFRQLVGGTFIGHPWNEEVGVRVEDVESPLVAGFGGKDFRIADEIYEYGPPFDRAKVRVLLSLDTANSNMGVKWIHRTDNDFVLAWIKAVGKGRIYNTSFGHRAELYWDRRVLQHYLDAIQFAAGDLHASTKPLPVPAPRAVPGTDAIPRLQR